MTSKMDKTVLIRKIRMDRIRGYDSMVNNEKLKQDRRYKQAEQRFKHIPIY